MNSWQQLNLESERTLGSADYSSEVLLGREYPKARQDRSSSWRVSWSEGTCSARCRSARCHFVRYAEDCAPRMQTRKKGVMQCYTTDEGRPFGICLQGPVPNRPRLLRLNGRGGERRGKRPGKEPGQVSNKKMNASEPLMTYRKRREDVKTVRSRYHGSRSGENLPTAWSASGMKVA